MENTEVSYKDDPKTMAKKAWDPVNQAFKVVSMGEFEVELNHLDGDTITAYAPSMAFQWHVESEISEPFSVVGLRRIALYAGDACLQVSPVLDGDIWVDVAPVKMGVPIEICAVRARILLSAGSTTTDVYVVGS